MIRVSGWEMVIGANVRQADAGGSNAVPELSQIDVNDQRPPDGVGVVSTPPDVHAAVSRRAPGHKRPLHRGHVTGGAVEGRAAPFRNLRDRCHTGESRRTYPTSRPTRRGIAGTRRSRPPIARSRRVGCGASVSPYGPMMAPFLTWQTAQVTLSSRSSASNEALGPRSAETSRGRENPAECRLLRVQRGMAVETDLLRAVECEIDLEVRIRPGLGVRALRPFSVDLRVAAATCTRRQGGQPRRDSFGGRPLERLADHEDVHRPGHAVGEEADHQDGQDTDEHGPRPHAHGSSPWRRM